MGFHAEWKKLSRSQVEKGHAFKLARYWNLYSPTTSRGRWRCWRRRGRLPSEQCPGGLGCKAWACRHPTLSRLKMRENQNGDIIRRSTYRICQLLLALEPQNVVLQKAPKQLAMSQGNPCLKMQRDLHIYAVSRTDGRDTLSEHLTCWPL